jgi:hypothetical protein
MMTHIVNELEVAVECTYCDSVYRITDRRLTCANCGAALKLSEDMTGYKEIRYAGSFAALRPFANLVDEHMRSVQLLREGSGLSAEERFEGRVVCGWCRHQYDHRPDGPNCTNCGGVLPLPPSLERGPAPPATPRTLPAKFRYRIYYKQNHGGIIGLLCIVAAIPLICLTGLIGLLIFLFGSFAAYSNFLIAHRRVMALRQGVATPGWIESVYLYGSADQSKPMFRVNFRFQLNDEMVRGLVYTYDPQITKHFVGQPVWVVYLPSKPACHDNWPPLA